MKQRVQRLYRMILGGGILIPLLVGCTKRQQPNIIVIMCDDLGYNDVGCYGQHLIETPNIDRMAREGMRFTQAYAGSPVSALRAKDLDDNTLVIFTSDNGPHAEGGADPAFFGYNATLRGIRRDTHEGGVRVPFIAWWPQNIEEGTVNDHILAFYDIMPTFCELAGVDEYVERYKSPTAEVDHFDGISFAPTLLDNGEQQPHEFLYWEFEETDQVAVRMGDWKMVSKRGVPHLYNLANDLHEDYDIAAEHPEIVRRMVEIAHREHTESPYFKVTLPHVE